MAKEIERKFLVDPELWVPQGRGMKIIQGYLTIDPDKVIRVRITDNHAFLTIKSSPNGIERDEYEYEIPLADARELLPKCGGFLIEKVRYHEKFADKIWEIDVF
ncbi:MAG TPA: hypothetical protein PLK12_17135, partial [Prolixibacteraceae bacterium]|nr:hypothetical protein [Prolixibacteraceae bacterium]